MKQVVINNQVEPFKDNLNQLDALLALRGFACLMVVLNHCFIARGSITYKNYDFTWVLYSSGEVAVWIFFTLSGYLMGKAFYSERYTLDTSGVINFFRNRIIRIFPLYYFSTLILSLFVRPEVLKIENWGYLFRTLTFTYNYTLPVGVNTVLWSLAIEVQFYLCVPFIYSYFKRHLFDQQKILLAAFYITLTAFILRFSVWITFYAQIHNDDTYLTKYWYVTLLLNLDVFLYGFLLNAWLKCEKRNDEKLEITKQKKTFRLPSISHQTIAVAIVIILYFFTAHHYYFQELRGLARTLTGVRTSTTFFLLQPLTALVISFFILAFESYTYNNFQKNEKLSFTAILRNPIRSLEIFGNLSYGVYIWHAPIMEKAGQMFTSEIANETFYLRLTAVLILSTLLATVTYYLVELPAIKWKFTGRK